MHDSLLSALSRMIQEEGKKHMELTANILTIFAVVSDFPELHPIITEHRLGSAAISLLEFTLQQFHPSKQQRHSSTNSQTEHRISRLGLFGKSVIVSCLEGITTRAMPKLLN